LLGRLLCLLPIDRLDLWSLLLTLSVSAVSMSTSCSSSSRSSLLLLLLEDGLVGSALNSADLPGLVLVLVLGRASVVTLFPREYDGAAKLVEVELFNAPYLADDLGETVHLLRELGHKDHCLDVFFYDNTHFCHSPEVGGKLVDSEGRVGVDRDPYRQSCLELEISGANSWIAVLGFEGFPQFPSVIFVLVLVLDGVVEAEGDVPDSFGIGYAHSIISFFWSSVTVAEAEVEALAFALVSVAVASSSAASSSVTVKVGMGARYQSAGLSSASINHCPWFFRKLRMGGAHC
jgi:hypothetical protein